MKLGLILAASALAQADIEQPPVAAPTPLAANDAGVIAYPAAFFVEARPTNAFDMIQRLPGFSFDGGDGGVRGFAGAAGNVLIDGARPTSKAVSLEDMLKRMPAASVVRIDLIRGGAPGIDMQGHQRVAKVVRSTAASQDAAVSVGGRLYGGGWLGPYAAVEWSRRAGALSLEGAVAYEWESSADGGRGARIRYFPGGTLREQGPIHIRELEGLLSANGSAQLDLVENIYRLNLGVSRDDSREYESLGRYAPDGAWRGDQVTREKRVRDRIEVGGDYTRLLSETMQAQLIALQTLSWTKSDETSVQPGTAEGAVGDEKEGESILRAVLTARPSGALTLEGGAEGAYNFLDAATVVTEDGVVIRLPNGTVRVEEKRAEAFATASWKPTDRLSLEAGSRFEASRISQTGDTDLSRGFFFAKPRLLLAYAPDALSQLRLRMEREVGQLDFGDFVGQADFSTSVITAGGAELDPERAWVFEAAAERRFWDRGALVLTLTHEAVQKVVDRVVVDGRFDAPGNIGDGRRDRVNLALAVPLDRLGIRNGLVTGSANWRWSRVTDPVTGQARRISGEQAFGTEIGFSQDIARLSSTWGVDFRSGDGATTYRINEIRRQSEDSLWHAYWDWKPRPSLSIRAEIRNINAREQRRWRTRYAGLRSAGVVSEVERQHNAFPTFAYLRVRKAL